MFKSASLRLAALYTAAFVAAVLVLGSVTVLTTRTALARQFESRILSESSALAQEFRIEGLRGVAQAVEERDRTRGARDYGVVGRDARQTRGPLAGARPAAGWSDLSTGRGGDEHETIRVY